MANPVARLREKGLSTDRIEEYMAAFSVFDTSKSGKISAADLESLLNGKFGMC